MRMLTKYRDHKMIESMKMVKEHLRRGHQMNLFSLGSNHPMLLTPLIHASNSHLTSNETTPSMSKPLNLPSSDIPGVPSFQKDYGMMSFSTVTLTSTKSTPDIMHSMWTTDMHKQLEKSMSFSIWAAH